MFKGSQGCSRVVKGSQERSRVVKSGQWRSRVVKFSQAEGDNSFLTLCQKKQ